MHRYCASTKLLLSMACLRKYKITNRLVQRRCYFNIHRFGSVARLLIRWELWKASKRKLIIWNRKIRFILLTKALARYWWNIALKLCVPVICSFVLLEYTYISISSQLFNVGNIKNQFKWRTLEGEVFAQIALRSTKVRKLWWSDPDFSSPYNLKL